MTDNTKPKSKLSEALGKSLVATTGGEVKKSGGLAGALTRRDNTAAAPVTGPKTADIGAVEKVVNSSVQTARTAYNDQVRETANNKGICFVIDATGSREHSWRQAQRTQAQMFDALKTFDVEIGIVCHRGERVKPLGWFKDSGSAQRAMGEVTCETGQTRALPSIDEALRPRGGKVPSSIILVGDAFEEYGPELEQSIRKLKEKKVKVYAFLEGSDSTAAYAFERLATETGGVFKKFGDSLDLNLTDLCVAAATLDVGGQAAFDKLLASGHKGATAMLTELKNRPQIGHGTKYIGYKP